MFQKLLQWFIIEEEEDEKLVDDSLINVGEMEETHSMSFLPILINNTIIGSSIIIALTIVSFLSARLELTEWGALIIILQVFLFALSSFIYILIMAKSISNYKDDNEGYISYLTAFLLSYLTALCMAFIGFLISIGIFVFFGNQIIDVAERTELGSIFDLMFMTLFSAFAVSLSSLNFGTFVGILSALIISAIMYRNKPVPFNAN